MRNEKVYEIVDFILNKATDPEVEILISAIKRRLDDAAHGLDKMNPQKMAGQLSRQATNQVGASMEQIRDMVRKFVAEKIKQEAPGISTEELEKLVDTWVPDTGGAKSSKQTTNLPKDALLTMVGQFISYSCGQMSASERSQLNDQIRDWPDRFWQQFPQSIKESIALFLKGHIDEDTFWSRIEKEVS